MVFFLSMLVRIVLFQKRTKSIISARLQLTKETDVFKYVLFFSRKEPKALSLRGYNELKKLMYRNIYCSFPEKNQKRYLCEATINRKRTYQKNYLCQDKTDRPAQPCFGRLLIRDLSIEYYSILLVLVNQQQGNGPAFQSC
jgi:hypothetical protein